MPTDDLKGMTDEELLGEVLAYIDDIITPCLATWPQLRAELLRRLEEREKLREALKLVNDLFAEDFIVKKIGGPITNGDQERIDKVFIGIEAALAATGREEKNG